MKAATLRRVLQCLTLVLFLPALAACSSMVTPATTASAASRESVEVVGEGALIVGVVSFSEPVNRSDGAADAVQKAAKLAAASLKSAPLTLVILPETRASGAEAAGRRFAEAGARVILGGSDPGSVSSLAQSVSASSVPIISLAPTTDTRLRIYSASLAPRDEALVLLAEAKRRKYTRIALVAGPETDGTGLVSVLSGAAPAEGIEIVILDGQSDAAFAAGMAAAVAGGKMDALVFTTGPQRASGLLAGAGALDLSGLAIVGNAGWALAEPLPPSLRNAWYPSLPRAALTKFVDQYRKAYGETPTLAAAVIYDLVIMAAVLQQVAGSDPFSAGSLQSDLGFKGFTGPFTFGAVGLAGSREYEIVAAR